MTDLAEQGVFAILTLLLALGLASSVAMAWHHRPLPGIPPFAAVLGALAITAVVFYLAPPQLRVLADEANLLGTAQGMYLDHRPTYATSGLWTDGALEALDTRVDKRPLLFPVLVAIAHHLRGYDLTNAYAINFGLLTGLLAMVQRFVARLRGEFVGWTAVVLAASAPIVGLSASSAGFDLLSVTLEFALFALTLAIAREPSRPLLRLWWCTALLFANTRYESAGVAAFAALALLPGWRAIVPLVRPDAWLYALTPMFLVPVGSALWNHGDELQAPPGRPAFSLALMKLHAQMSTPDFLDPRGNTPFNGWVNLLGCGALVVATATWLVRRQRPARMHVTALVLVAGVVAQILLYLSFHGGYTQRPSVVRYFLPASLAMALAPVLLLPLARPAARLALFAFAVGAAWWQVPALKNNVRLNRMFLPEELRVETEYLRDHETPRTLILSDSPHFHIIRGVSAMHYGQAAAERDRLRAGFQTGRWDHIFVIQRTANADSPPNPEERLPPEFVLTERAEWPVHGHIVRLSQVTAVR